MHNAPYTSTSFVSASKPPSSSVFFFFNDTATTEIYTLSLHDALPISHLLHKPFTQEGLTRKVRELLDAKGAPAKTEPVSTDRKSTRLNSSHSQISYAVFCLKKKRNLRMQRRETSITSSDDDCTALTVN